MKKIILAIVLILASSYAGANDTIKRLSSKGDVSFVPPKAEKRVLSNGMTVYALEDHFLPIFQGKIFIKGGGAYVRGKKDGISSVMAALLKDGGTLSHAPSEIRDILDENAIDIGFSSSMEVIEGGVSSLGKNRNLALTEFFEMIFTPRFDANELSTVKQRMIDGLKRERQISGPIAHKDFRELVYGKKNVWGYVVKPKDIKKIKRGDVSDYYNSIVSPDRMILAIAGDFRVKELFGELEKITGVYPKKELAPLKTDKPDAVTKEETMLVKKKFTQSAISMGHLGTTRNNPDKFALVVLNDILGGSASFSNRLTDTVRVKGGLAYEIWSNYGFGPKGVDGIFEIHAKTRNQTTKKAVQTIKSEVIRMRDSGITDAELARSKAGLLKGLVFQYERPFEIVKAIAGFVYFDYPENYIDVYKKGIESVEMSDVNNAAKKYLRPDDFKTVVVGRYE